MFNSKNIVKLLRSSCFLLIFFSYSLVNISAQTDSIFWFGAPEVIADHGDRPIRIFCSSTLKNVDVVLSQPANPSFIPLTVTIPIGSSHSFDLTPWISSIESTPNQILNNGLLLESTGPITAYYEVMPRLNPDIFSFKGDNALGTEFWIPGQNHFYNGPYRGVPRSGYIIVATEDNTVITIRPKNNLVGHPAGIPFDITLNKGQCYATRAIGGQNNQHVGGDYVIATKKIAITLKDDSLGLGIGCWDLGGDQLIPTNIIGTDYIIRRGSLRPEDRYFITATMDNTMIFINGSNIPIANLSAGEIGNFELKDPSVHISSNHPIYVLHVTGFGCELGFGIVPPYPCTGSRSVYFTRSNSDFMGLFVFTRTDNISSFNINNNPATLTPQAFAIVPGTNGDYSSAYIDLSNVINVGKTTNINNTSGVFHVGIINGRSGTSSRYGYFSNFGRAKSESTELSVCKGDTVVLTSNSITSSKWYRNEKYINSDSLLIVVIDSATKIKLITEMQYGCIDTIVYDIKLNKSYQTSLSQQICEGDYLEFGDQIISENGNYVDSLRTIQGCDSIFNLNLIVKPVYSDTIIEYSCFTKDTGWHTTFNRSINGCDSILSTYTILTLPSTDTLFYTICQGDSVNIHGDWINTTDTILHINISQQGCDSNELFFIYFKPTSQHADSLYLCHDEEYLGRNYPSDTILIDTLTNSSGCDSFNSLSLLIRNPPNISISGDSILCNNSKSIIEAKGGINYIWINGKQTDKIIIDKAGLYWVEGYDEYGCKGKDSISIFTPILNLKVNSHPPICPENNDGFIRILDTKILENYFVNDRKTDSIITNLSPGNYLVKVVDKNGCTKEEMISLETPRETTLTLPDTLCGYVGNSITIIPTFDFDINSSSWFPSDHIICDTCFITDAIIQKKGWLYYLDLIDTRGCLAHDSIFIKGVLRNIYVPNVFSPNGDRINDKFTLYSNDGYEIIEELKIYSRWGELLFVGVDLPFNDPKHGWNGIFNTEPMNPGVYAYVARVLRTDGKTEILYGDVTLAK